MPSWQFGAAAPSDHHQPHFVPFCACRLAHSPDFKIQTVLVNEECTCWTDGRRRRCSRHSTICQPDDSHTFGRTFGGRPAREATDRRAQREPPWRQKIKLPPLRAERRRDISRWCGRITARDQPGAPDILVMFPLVSIHSSP